MYIATINNLCNLNFKAQFGVKFYKLISFIDCVKCLDYILNVYEYFFTDHYFGLLSVKLKLTLFKPKCVFLHFIRYINENQIVPLLWLNMNVGTKIYILIILLHANMIFVDFIYVVICEFSFFFLFSFFFSACSSYVWKFMCVQHPTLGSQQMPASVVEPSNGRPAGVRRTHGQPRSQPLPPRTPSFGRTLQPAVCRRAHCVCLQSVRPCVSVYVHAHKNTMCISVHNINVLLRVFVSWKDVTLENIMQHHVHILLTHMEKIIHFIMLEQKNHLSAYFKYVLN